MATHQEFEQALVYYREKWAKIKDPEVNYNFPIPSTPLKDLFLQQVEKHPDKVYIYRKDEKCTYRECNEMAVRIANAFLAMGLQKRDRVITYVSNSIEFIAIAQACFKTGIIMVNTNPRSTADEIIRRVRDCTPRLVIVDTDGAAAVTEALHGDMLGVEHIIFCPAMGQENPNPDFLPWESLLSNDLTEPDIPIYPEDILVMQYTGGTTGVLKGCCQTNHAFVAKAMAQVEYFKAFLTPEDYENYIVLIGIGMSHAFGFSQAIIVNMTIGGSIFLAENLDELLMGIEKYKPTVWPSVPLYMKLIASNPKYQNYNLSSLKCITCGSAPLPVEVIHKVEELTGAVITEGYGMTETVNTIAINGYHHRRVGTVGVVNPNIEYLIVDKETGTKVVPYGESGEIICRGECVMKEYWGKPEETANMVRDGWLYTGDIGRMDEDGFLIIMDRKKDLIISGGFNIFPSELEDVALMIDGVADAIAVGVPDDRRGEVPALFIQPREGAQIDLKQVEAFFYEKLSRFKVPKQYYLIDQIPRTKNNKPDRKTLKKNLSFYVNK